jgi:nucleoside-diphosphate-sugar epimerase
MKVLFIGGTGNISLSCTQLAAERGVDLYLLNRGRTGAEVPAGVKVISGDVRGTEIAKALEGQTFDAVVDFIGFEPGDVERDIALFRGRTGQYIFISSISVYQKPPTSYVVTESTPLSNPFWEYARLKIACEERLMREYRENGFPVTIVRPGHTYGRSMIPAGVGGSSYLVVDRMRRGKPIIVHGDGTALWVLTSSRDFAKGLVGLLGNTQAIGHAFHITTDEVLTWTQIYQAIGRAVGVEPKLVCVSADAVAPYLDANRAGSLLGDKMWSTVPDNTKIKRFVPDYVATTRFAEGVKESIAWHDADKGRQKISDEVDRTLDEIIERYEAGLARLRSARA